MIGLCKPRSLGCSKFFYSTVNLGTEKSDISIVSALNRVMKWKNLCKRTLLCEVAHSERNELSFEATKYLSFFSPEKTNLTCPYSCLYSEIVSIEFLLMYKGVLPTAIILLELGSQSSLIYLGEGEFLCKRLCSVGRSDEKGIRTVVIYAIWVISKL